jgi:hypothetical protein
MLVGVQVNPSRAPMHNSQSQACFKNTVRAVFEDHLSDFEMSSGATFGDLAGRLGHLAIRHRGRPIVVNVILGASH